MAISRHTRSLLIVAVVVVALVILSPLLLLAVQFVHLAVIDRSLPAIGASKATSGQVDDKPPLMLSIAITDRGFIVCGNAVILSCGDDEAGEPTIPLDGEGNYEFEKLTDLLVKVKSEYPDEQHMILILEPGIKYETAVHTMEASRDHMPEGAEIEREMLFPFVVVKRPPS